ncbi:MAG: amidohydrolase family protein [Clostridia bacterium]|nr:amidohydrolase family protein [Clostridia bacterium]
MVVGVAKIQKMLKEGVNVSLGTDGQGSGSNLDMFETMKFSSLLQKGIYEDVRSMESYEVLKMATINGAKALGLESEIRKY